MRKEKEQLRQRFQFSRQPFPTPTESIQNAMTRSDLHKEKHASKNQLPEYGILDGTSARTRPLCFDDIMLRRRNKGDSAKQISNAHDVDNSVTPIELPDCGHQDSEPMDEKSNSNYSKKVRSERKGKTRSSRKQDKLVQANDEGSLDPDAKSKKNASTNIEPGGKHERENHGNRRKAGLSSIGSVNGSDKRKDRDLYKKDTVSERCRVKSEIVKNQQQNEEREVYRKRKPDGHSDSDIEYKKRNVKDERKTEKLTSRGREKPEKENRHKRHHEEDHKPRDRITVKKNDTEKKGLEPSRTYPEEAGPKRRRSRSREREKDRGRRSRSQSPKAYKHTSKDGRDLGESVLSHSTKDRSGREHSDVDKKRISSNGSGSHYRRNTTSSGLGGYSPRKRKTEAAAKTPSPTRRSPERKNAGWDFQNAEKESSVADSTVSYMNTASQRLLLNVKELPSVSPVTTPVVQSIGVTLHTLSSQMHAIEAIQLTQATRPMRRLYVENLPASASEEDLKECINKLLMSTGVNYVQGTQPCISSIIHKEKNQALLEFLTPEDASAALSLDGMSFSGSSLKIRRPKDYAIVTTGLSDKSVGTVDSVSDIVEDSPNKIFIGGISKLYSSKMFLEIAKAFGAVKSFHFEFIAGINEPCAFLEYVDHSVTSKACAGLNGMRLGGKVLTAVPATPEPVLMENVGLRPIYVIPEHVKPLLEKPTTVVKLKNVLDPECLLSLAESEVEEILQDIKLECSRFGTVKSVNVAKTNSFATMEAHEVKNTSASVDVSNFEQLGETSCGAERVDKSEPQEAPNELENNRQTLEDRDGFDNSSGISDLLSGSIEPKEINEFKSVGDSLSDEIIKGNVKRDETCGPPMNDGGASAKDQENLSGLAGEFKEQNNVEFVSSIDEELKSEEKSSKIESFADVESDEQKKDSNGDKMDPTLADIERVFEAGCVFVEYRREEAACMAAHCLHGRTFDGRIVSVEYIGHDVYQTRFHG